MKVRRREFLKLAGLSAVRAAIPVKDEDIEPPGQENEEQTFPGLDQIINSGPVDVRDGMPCDSIEWSGLRSLMIKDGKAYLDREECEHIPWEELSGGWFHFASDGTVPVPEHDCSPSESDGSESDEWHHLILTDGKTEIPLDDGATLAVRPGKWYSLTVTENQVCLDGVPIGEAFDRFNWEPRLVLRPWVSSQGEVCECSICQRYTGWGGGHIPLSLEDPPAPEYDCDYYYPISEGEQFRQWRDPHTCELHEATLRWYDHGLHTYLMVNGFRVGTVLSRDIPDPGAYLRSIWSCGLSMAGYMLAEMEEA